MRHAGSAGWASDQTRTDGRERGSAPAAHYLVAGLLGVEALLALGFALWPPTPTGQMLSLVLCCVLALAAVACAVPWSGRRPQGLVEAFLVVAWVVPMAFVVTRPLEASQLLWAAMLLPVAVLVAFYLPLRRAAFHVATIVAVYLVSSIVLGSTRLLFAFALAVIIALFALVISWLRADRDRTLSMMAAMATHDPLTGLLNRRGLELEADVVRSNSIRAGKPTVVALIDLDGLKEVNDARGHDAGDALIASAVEHWQGNLRQGDLVARIGGDEFVLVLPQSDEWIAGELLVRMRDGHGGAWSQGWTVWSDDEPLAAALERADALMYLEKARRRGGS